MKFLKALSMDYIGIASATLCVVHCLLLPVLILFFGKSELLEKFSYLFLLISFYSAFEATKHTNNTKILTLIWLSFALLSICILFEDDFPNLEIGSYLASLGLIIGHILNMKFCKKC